MKKMNDPGGCACHEAADRADPAGPFLFACVMEDRGTMELCRRE